MTEEEVVDTPDSKEEEMVTVWSPEAADNIEINQEPIDEWVRSVDFKTTEDVPIPAVSYTHLTLPTSIQV